MVRCFFCIFYLLIFSPGLFSQDFSTQQKSWLFRIVMQTPALKSNLAEYFIYKHNLPVLPAAMYRNKYKEGMVNWDLVDEQILTSPDLLSVDFETLKSLSPGLLSELAVKLTLWELYTVLARAFEKDVPFISKEDMPSLCLKMLEILPESMKKDEWIKKKYESVFYRILNPSLSLFKKVDALSEVKSISLAQQKQILDYWHKFVNDYVTQQSIIYFENLAGRKIYYNGDLLAAGEGSASSGLLGAYEEVGDSYIQTGNGKGIGLFTYEMQLKRNQLLPKIESEVHIVPLKEEPTLLHLSLWGMDGRKKPLVVIYKGDKSYLLFADFKTGLFSPDDNLVMGTSYLTRLKEEEEKEINLPLQEMNKEGGLLSVYQREDSLRQQIKHKITTLELELDSLNKIGGVSAASLDMRKRKLDVLISNRSDKDRRLQDVNQKISEAYKQIDKSRIQLEKKRAVLGNSIQQWVVKDSLYKFEDGTVFDFKTQDLIFYQDSLLQMGRLRVKLLAASYSLHSKLKDEVQLYVNTTGGVGETKNELKQTDKNIKHLIFEKTFLFNPDEYLLSDKVILSDSLLKYSLSKNVIISELYALGIDSSLKYNNKSTLPYEILKNDSSFIKARRVELKMEENNDTIFILVKAYTDSGTTRLSKTDDEIFDSVVDLHSKKQSYNPGLSVLRLISVVRKLESELGVHFSKESIYVEPLIKTYKLYDFTK